MIRKHVNQNQNVGTPHCDELGILVWYDMPNVDSQLIWQDHKYFEGTKLQGSARSETIYRKVWKEIMNHLYSYPSIVVWVSFNEAWG